MYKKYYNYIYEYFDARKGAEWPFVPMYPDKLFENLSMMDPEGSLITAWFAISATIGFLSLMYIGVSGTGGLGHPAGMSIVDTYKEVMLWCISLTAYNNCAYLLFAMDYNRLVSVVKDLERMNETYAGIINKQATLLNSYHTLASKTSINSYSLFIDPYDKLYHATQILPSSTKSVTRLIQLTFDSTTNPTVIEFVIQKSPLMDFVNLTVGISLV